MIQTYQSNNRTEKPSPRAEIELVHDEKSKETLITAQDKVWSLPEMIQSAHIHFYTPENQRTGAKCTDTRFYAQCGTKQENQRHYQMHTHPLLHTVRHRTDEPNEGIHSINLYTVAKNMRPCLPMYSG